MISVLCPTRRRPEAFERSVESLRSRASGHVEVLAWVDADDDRPHGADVVVTGERVGYGRMQVMYGELAELAVGRWLLLWNDDALMLTERWDEVVENYDCGSILNPATNHGPTLAPFPVIPAWMVQRLGHFSLNQHCDSWWQEIGERLGILTPISVEVFHDRADLTGGNDDATFRDRVYDPCFYGSENLGRIEADVNVLRALL